VTLSDETDDPPALASPEPMAIPSLGAPPAPKTPGRHERCPHCGAITFLEKSTRLRYKCGVCGKARVPVDDPKIARSNAEKDALERASRARNAQAALSVVSGIAAALSAVSLVGVLILVLALSPGFFLSSFALVAALAPMLVAAFGVVRARRRHAEIEPALLEAWQSVAADVVDARKEVTAGELAKVLRTTSDHAEQLLAYLLATGAATSPMTDDGEVRYRSSKAPIRVAEFEEDSPVPLARATRDAPQAEEGNTTTAADEAVRDALAEDELADEQAQEEAARAAAKERKVT
jgi:ribosomal protein S27AE